MKMWGGRFKKKTDPKVEEFTKSIHFDYKLAEYDLLGSMAHVQVLKQAGLLSLKEATKLIKGLNTIYTAVKKTNTRPTGKYEDVHTYIELALQKQVGALALKLHTARSRNDQVVLATKLYCKMTIPQLKGQMAQLIARLNELAAKNKDIILPGFTHLQHAQPVYLQDYLRAYIEMLNRDSRRLSYIDQNLKITLGAGALAGTPIEAAKYVVKSAKLFNIEPTTNALDAVSDRDFVIELISALSITAMHLSRLSEDLIIWSTKEFAFIELDEAFCTGSSLMPQKKNPDVLELIRGYAGRLYGNLVSVLTMMKGLPLAYNRDMQLDKEPLFESLEIVSRELEVLQGLINTLNFNRAKIKEQLKDEALYVTDLVYYLVAKKVPFRQAHTIVGKLFRYALDHKIKIKDLPENKLRQFAQGFVKKEIIKLFDPQISVKMKRSIKRK